MGKGDHRQVVEEGFKKKTCFNYPSIVALWAPLSP